MQKKTNVIRVENHLEIIAKKDYGHYTTGINALRVMDERSSFALSLVREAVKTAFAPDGEDSSGRQQGRRMEATEVVDFCFAVADATFAKLEADGRYMAMPTQEELEAAFVDTN